MKLLYVFRNFFFLRRGFHNTPKNPRWSPGKNANNTVHIDDIAGAAWASAEWMAPLGRTAANQLAGEELLFHNDKSKVKEVGEMPPHNVKPVAPLFNLVRFSVSIIALDLRMCFRSTIQRALC
jgi:hypothetical protein